MHSSRVHVIYVTDCRRANANSHGTRKSCKNSRVLCLLQHRTQLILEVFFFLSWIVQIFKHKEFRKRLYLFSVNALIYILKHLVYTTASRRSQQSFGRYMQRMAFQCRRHARNQTRNQKQDLSLGSWKDFLLDFKKCLLKSGKQRWSCQQLHEIIAHNNELRSKIKARTQIYEQQ